MLARAAPELEDPPGRGQDLAQRRGERGDVSRGRRCSCASRRRSWQRRAPRASAPRGGTRRTRRAPARIGVRPTAMTHRGLARSAARLAAVSVVALLGACASTRSAGAGPTPPAAAGPAPGLDPGVLPGPRARRALRSRSHRAGPERAARPAEAGTPTVRLGRADARFVALVTPLWNPGEPETPQARADTARLFAELARRKALAGSVETRAPARGGRSRPGCRGFWFSATDRDLVRREPRADEWRHVLQGAAAVGPVIVAFTLLDDGPGPQREELLELVRSARSRRRRRAARRGAGGARARSRTRRTLSAARRVARAALGGARRSPRVPGRRAAGRRRARPAYVLGARVSQRGSSPRCRSRRRASASDAARLPRAALAAIAGDRGRRLADGGARGRRSVGAVRTRSRSDAAAARERTRTRSSSATGSARTSTSRRSAPEAADAARLEAILVVGPDRGGPVAWSRGSSRRASFPVHTYEVDAFGALEVPALSGYLQEVAGHHAAELGVGLDVAPREGAHLGPRAAAARAAAARWRSGTRSRSRRGPRGIERLAALARLRRSGAATAPRRRARRRSGTCSTSPRAGRCGRARCSTRASRGRVRPSVAPLAPGKLPPLASWEREKRFHVRYADIDVNLHVTNASYVTWAIEATPVELWRGSRLAAVEVHYLAEGLHGAAILSRVARTGDGDVRARDRARGGREGARAPRHLLDSGRAPDGERGRSGEPRRRGQRPASAAATASPSWRGRAASRGARGRRWRAPPRRRAARCTRCR